MAKAPDYRDSTLSGITKADDAKADGTQRWWTLEGKEQADAISSNLGFFYKHQELRLAQLVMSARLYGNLSLLGLNGLTYSSVASAFPSIRDRISYNLIQSCIDAITSKIAKNKPKPLFLTSGGDYKLQRRAKNLNKFNDGIFWENQAYRLGPQVFRDACVFGDGIIHVFDGGGRVKWERCVASEFFIDEVEGFYENPRSLHRVKNIDRDVLLAWVKENKLGSNATQLVELAKRSAYAETKDGNNISDMIQVRESWHLPSRPGAKDGERCVSIDNGTLLGAKWKHDRFPIAKLSWSKRLNGYWGQGLAEQLQNLQMEINKLLYIIQRSMHLAGSFKILLHTTAKIVSEHINNDIGSIVKWSGNVAPSYVTPPIVPQEIYEHLGTLIARGFEQSGVSQLSATSQKPAGLNSGKALREFSDIESDRFMTVGQAYENLFLDCSELSILTVKDIIEERGGNYKVKSPSHKFIDTVDWKSINLEEDQYVMQSYPISSLPDEPAGRLETLTEWAQGGLIEQDEVRGLMDFPDLQRSDNLYTAQRELLGKMLDGIVDDGEYTAPQPAFDNLQMGYTMAQRYYAQGRLQGLEEERQELLRRFMIQCQAGLQAAIPPPPALPPGMPPQGVTAAPPVSDILPNGPTQIQ